MKIQNGLPLKAPGQTESQKAQQDARLKDAAQMYENHFLNEMVKAMRATVPTEEGYIKPGFAEKIYTEQLDQQYVDGWAQKGGVGLADVIYSQLKERFGGGANLPPVRAKDRMLPITPKREPHGLTSPDSIQMKTLPPTAGANLSYRFEVHNPSTDGFTVQAPMAGTVVKSEPLASGWNMVRLDHGQGLRSEMTFPGQRTPIDINTSVEPGQKLGILDSERPVLAWNLDWS